MKLKSAVCYSLLIMVMWMSGVTRMNAQTFQHIAGNANENFFTQVIDDGVQYFVIGQDIPTPGGLPQATVTHLSATGFPIATIALPFASVWNDAVLVTTGGGGLILVGSTQPVDATSKSLIGRVTPFPLQFQWLHEYDGNGRDAFQRIVENTIAPSPDPYYVLGYETETGGSTLEEDVVLHNFSSSGTLNWKNIYPQIGDDEFMRDFEVDANGNMIMGGNNDAGHGVIYLMDQTGTVTAANQISLRTFQDIEVGVNGIYVVSGQTFGIQDFVSKFNPGLQLIWDRQVTGITSLSRIWEGAPGQFYLTGSQPLGDIILKVLEAGPAIDWVKYPSVGTNTSNGSAWPLSGSRLGFVDGRMVSAVGFGAEDAFLSVSDLDLNTCMISTSTAGLILGNAATGTPGFPMLESVVILPAPMILTQSVLIDWDAAVACDSCVCSYDQVLSGMTLQYQGTDVSLACLPHGVQTPVIPCPTGDIEIYGFYGCESFFSGEPCAETEVQYILTDQQSNILAMGTTTNYPSLLFSQNLFTNPGTYFLTLSTLCPGAQDSCICTMDWIVECDPCCLDFDLFCQTVEDSTSIVVDHDLCKVTLSIGDLPDCDSIEYVNWGDGSIDFGSFGAGHMPMHIYSGSGTYYISYLAYEIDPNTGFYCFEKILMDTIVLNCPSCACPDTLASGIELIQNGDFENGYTSFTSDYTIITGSCAPGTYALADFTSVQNLCNNWTGLDHTTGNPNWYFLAADGSFNTTDAAYRYTLNLTPSTTYSFCAYVNNLNEPGFDRDDPEVEAWLVPPSGPSLLLDAVTPAEYPDQWIRMAGTYISPASISGVFQLEIRSAHVSFEGNNFALDDISFKSCVSPTQDSCCKDYDQFCQNMMNAVTITLNQAACQATLHIGNLPPCDSILFIDFGQPPVQQGPWGSGQSVTHTYTAGGTYIISYLVAEYDLSTTPATICFEKFLHDTITIICDSPVDTCYNTCPSRQWNSLSNSHFIHDMVVFQGKLIVGGSFNVSGGVNIAAWDGSNFTTLGAGVNGPIRALAVYNGELYAGGSFTMAGNTSVNNIAKWNGSTWQDVGGGIQGGVLSLQVYGPNLIAGGSFTMAGTSSANNIAQWDGNTWNNPFTTGITGTVHGMGIYNNTLVVGGVFSSPFNNIAAWNGISWSNLGGGINMISGNVFQGSKAILQVGPDLIVGGRFMDASGMPGTQHIARWNGTSWNDMATGVNTSFEGLYDLILYDGDLYAGGLFTQIGGNTISGVAKWDGANWSDVQHQNQLVWALAEYQDTSAGATCDLYSGGEVFLNIWDCLTATHDPVAVELNLFPNPNHGQFTLDLSSLNHEHVHIRIFDLNGKIVSTYRVGDTTMPYRIMSDGLAEGMYYLQVYAEDTILAWKRFVSH